MFALQRIFQPEIFQGRNKKDNYFEGWYFLQIDNACSHSLALIPGVSLNQSDPHAFIQVIFSNNAQSHQTVMNREPTLVTDYFRFPLSDFKYNDTPFGIQFGHNIFSNSYIEFDLDSKNLHVKGHFHLGKQQRIQQSILVPNIMGFFGYLSFMECYHGVISMNHSLSGEIFINGKTISFKDGTGYIEKDWGHSFPKHYVWVQCNRFLTTDASLMLSVANIPFLCSTFKGFICNLIVHGKEYRMATYNCSKIILEEIEEKKVYYRIKRKQLILSIKAHITKSAALKAPKNGHMEQIIKEGLSGKVHIQLMDNKGNILYEDYGTCVGVEVVLEK